MLSSSKIRVDRDFRYTGYDGHSFIRCCLCRCYTPFVFYVVSKRAIDELATILPPNHNFVCVNCLPKPKTTPGGNALSLFQEGSLFDDEEFLSTFRGYEYYNPYYELYSKTCRVIITENCCINANYKRFARKPMPTIVKVRKLIDMFPAIHRMPFEKYDSMQAMHSGIREKYRAIRRCYSTNNTEWLENSTVSCGLDEQESNQFSITSRDSDLESVVTLPLLESGEYSEANIGLDSLSPVIPTRVNMNRIHDSQAAGPSGLQQQQPRTQQTPSSPTIEPTTSYGPQPKRNRLSVQDI
uniref:Uncharacterized protein n=1 Tax=Anopheles epiroticus TaxID=199890 RepID=A0A182PLK5_9DIPT